MYADWYNGEWALKRTTCESCGAKLDDRELIEAIVTCELGASPNGEFNPLYNPSICQLTTKNGKSIR